MGAIALASMEVDLTVYENNNSGMKTGRLVGLDCFRILSVFFIFLFHSAIHIKCDYGFMTSFISMGAIYMTAFFLLSGFSIYYTWGERNLHNIEGIKKFYKKRMIAILPLYYTVALLYVLLLGQETPFQNIVIAPAEILGIQSMFNGLFAVTHNGGTWFVSCILLCYLVYPYLQEVINQLRIKNKIILLFVVFFIILYAPFVVRVFHTDGIYANPFFRLLEFTIGVLLCSMLEEIRKCKIFKFLFSWWAVFLEFVILVAGVSIAIKIGAPNDYMLFNWLALPMFMMQLVSSAGLNFTNRIQNSRIIRFLCEISYAFFLGQFFTWKTTQFIVDQTGIDTNFARITISLILCILYAILLHEIIEKPISLVIQSGRKLF